MLDPCIEPIGTFLDVHEDGHLVNPCHADHLGAPWDAAIDALLRACEAQFKETLHSVYLRGSVPRNLGRPGASDLDVVLLFEPTVPESTTQWVEDVHTELASHMPGQTDVEFLALDVTSLLDTPWAQPLRALFKTHAFCIYGDDILAQLPSVSPGSDLYIHAPHIAADISDVLKILKSEKDPEEIKGYCTWVMTRLVRSGLELLLVETGQYSRDLYTCYTHFAEHRPKHARDMAQALNWAVSPTTDRRALKRFLSGFAQTVAGEASRLCR